MSTAPGTTAPARPRPPRRRPPSPLHVITASLGLFLVVLTLLALQVRSGKDPSLSSGATTVVSGGTSTSPSSSAKTVVTRTS